MLRLDFYESLILADSLTTRSKEEFLFKLFGEYEATAEPELKAATYSLWLKVGELTKEEFARMCDFVESHIIEDPIDIPINEPAEGGI